MLNIFTAQIVFVTYGSLIIGKSGTSFSSEGPSIFMAVIQVVASFVIYKLIDSRGRKFLLIFSLVGCAIGHAVMVAYMYLNENGFGTADDGNTYTWLFHLTPVMCMSAVIFMSSIYCTLSPVCTAESFPYKMRAFGTNFGNIVLNLFAFMLYKVYPPLEETMGLQAWLMIFAGCCTLGTIYVAVFMGETDGMMIDSESVESNEEELKEMNDELMDITDRMRSRRRSSYRINRFDARKYSIISMQV